MRISAGVGGVGRSAAAHTCSCAQRTVSITRGGSCSDAEESFADDDDDEEDEEDEAAVSISSRIARVASTSDMPVVAMWYEGAYSASAAAASAQQKPNAMVRMRMGNSGKESIYR